MATIPKQAKDKLVKQVKFSLGYPIRPFELTDEQIDTFIEMTLEDYSSIVNQWLIEQQWVSLQGLEVDGGNFFNAYTTKSNDFINSFTYAYSKQVGLGSNAPANSEWELKRDFIVTSANTQTYIIPANREINEVLWETPPEINQGLVDPMGQPGWYAGSMGWSYLGRPAMYMQPTYSMLLTAQDRRMKQRVLQSELTYRITGLASGEKLLHLYPVPGGKNEIPDKWGKHMEGRKVFYFYYDTEGKNRNDCLNDNPDVVTLPSDPPLELLTWDRLNQMAQQTVRDLLIARVKITLGSVRGFYSGVVGVAQKELTLDYRHLLDEGTREKEMVEKRIFDSLAMISLDKLTEIRAKIAENVNKAKTYQPMKKPIVLF